jgi:hypothetical protein
MNNITMDFFGDLVDIMRYELDAAGYKLNGKETPDEICMRYRRVTRRGVRPAIRKVLVSREFLRPPHHQAGFDLIKAKSEKGEDLKPHQTRLLKRADTDDDLLKDWGIHHFHLGTTIEADGYVNRDDALLYARVTNDTLFCIQVLDHDAFTDQQLLQILHDNWPDSITHWRVQGLSVNDRFSAQEIRVVRKKGAQLFIAVADGTVYAPIGGGISSSTASVLDVVGCDRLKKLCRDLEEQMLQLQKETDTGFRRPARLRLRITKNTQKTIVVLDGNPEIAVATGPSIDI